MVPHSFEILSTITLLFQLFQAELVAVEGKEIETHYVLARERIRRWNSTSKCYLLVENLPTPLQVVINSCTNVTSVVR